MCMLRGDRYETVYHLISECNKVAQKDYMSRKYWVGKMVH